MTFTLNPQSSRNVSILTISGVNIISVLFSYKTPVAVSYKGITYTLKVGETERSKTTARHINKFLYANPATVNYSTAKVIQDFLNDSIVKEQALEFKISTPVLASVI